jgi:hypothetical protein
LTPEERVTAIADFGFTDRQARFLDLVIRHAGVCVPRQYATFAGIANGGEKNNALFEKLIRRGYAVISDCVHNRARLYHVRYKPLYRAIGEPDSRYRRPVPARQAVERLMLLDAVLASPGHRWLTTEAEKVAHCAALAPPKPTTKDPPELAVDVPRQSAGALLRVFPIGVDSNSRALLLYLASVPWTNEFRMFLQAHAPLMRVVPEWTVRLVFPRPLDCGYSAFQEVIHEELEMPLHRATVIELKWYFEHRQKAASGPVDAQTQAFLNRAAQVYGTPRFTLLYRRWLKHGDTVFDALCSPVIAEALTAGRARVECMVLPHAYRHLSPLVNRVRRVSEAVENPTPTPSSTMSSHVSAPVTVETLPLWLEGRKIICRRP